MGGIIYPCGVETLGKPVTLRQVVSVLPTPEDGHLLLGQVRWGRCPKCPYCMSRAHTRVRGTVRYHCNGCTTTYSATVGTVMHASHADLRQWFAAGSAYLERRRVGVRELAQAISVNKNTAARMLRAFEAADLSSHRLTLAVDDRIREELATIGRDE